ncbi:MAG: hypothetical protein K6T51_08810 [Rubrobacteraceae bacterium]|nr:hypothetical protein [Rubrobacteraceae bacterium]MCL6438701.1 hypothetical protein [Rubrobacteraceae bacterium]
MEKLLEGSKERGYLKVWGRQRTDFTHVLGALRVLSKWERTAETMRAALNALAATNLDWLREHADPEWFEHYGRRIEDQRLPKGKEAREEYLKTVGAHGIRLLARIADSHAPQGLKELAGSRSCADFGSNTTREAMERYGSSTQKGCLKVPTASNHPRCNVLSEMLSNRR